MGEIATNANGMPRVAGENSSGGGLARHRWWRWSLLGLGMFGFSLVVAVGATELSERAERLGIRARSEGYSVSRMENLRVEAENAALAAEQRGAAVEAVRQTRLALARGQLAEYHRALRVKYEQAQQTPWVLLPPDPDPPRVPPGTIPGRGPGLGGMPDGSGRRPNPNAPDPKPQPVESNPFATTANSST